MTHDKEPFFPDYRIKLQKGPCIYCGDYMEEKDHWPPRSFHWRGFLLDSCRSCNRKAFQWEPLDLFARIDIVKKKILKEQRRAIRNKECPAIIHLLEKRYAWNAKEHLLKLELGTQFARQPVARKCLEESKKRSFKLLEEWFETPKIAIKKEGFIYYP